MSNRSRRLPAVDAHYDGIILRQIRGDAMDLTSPDAVYHADLPRLRKGNFGALFVMVGDNHLVPSLRMIDAVRSMCEQRPKDYALCLNGADVRRAMRTGRLGLVMTIEGQVMFEESVELLRNWHRLGVRVASLTHGEGRFGGSRYALQADRSAFGYVTPAERDLIRRQTKGITPYARRALDLMAELNMPCDVSHTNDPAFWETLEYARGPLCYTHGNCYSLCPHARNLTDEMMKALAERGGVMALSFYRMFISQKEATLDRLVEHFLHALEIMGPDHVGLGSDYDGLPADQCPLLEAESLGSLWDALARRGVSSATLRKIASENHIRLLS